MNRHTTLYPHLIEEVLHKASYALKAISKCTVSKPLKPYSILCNIFWNILFGLGKRNRIEKKTDFLENAQIRQN
jgi:hypothetical protein